MPRSRIAAAVLGVAIGVVLAVVLSVEGGMGSCRHLTVVGWAAISPAAWPRCSAG